MPDPLARLQAALAGRYAIERELGRGGMATVYLAEDLKRHRPVAIKVLRPELTAELGAERFLREIEIAAKLTHPHILPVHDSGDAEGSLYYVMPFVEGESLRDRLARERQLPLEDAVQITREVADALAYAHRHGLVHRDIKPENILLESGHAVVSDFGIARAITEAGGATLTRTGSTIGTPAYMSPEQAVGEGQLDGRSDLYSLGCVLYEMLVGVPPHAASTAQAIIARRLTEPVSPPRRVRDTIPEAVEGAILRALAKVPADRYATAAEFAEALRRAGAGPETASRSIGTGRVAVLYLVSSLAVLGVVQLLVGQLGLPSWVVPGAIVLLLVGFPIVLVTVLAQRGAVPVPRRVSHWLTLRKAIFGGALAFGALGAVVTVYMLMRLGAKTGQAGPPLTRERPASANAPTAAASVAVLPFVNISPDRENEYFSDGMTEELINALTNVEGLRVASRTSSFAFKGKQENIQQIAERLHVGTVLEGSVRKEGDRVRITAQLINAADGYHLWSQAYEARMRDLFSLQEEISRAIVGALQVRLVGAPNAPLVRRSTSNLEAYDLYLRGRFFWNKRTEGGLRKGVEFFEQAIVADPRYALAYSGLADSYTLLGVYSYMPPKAALPRARVAAERALKADDGLAEGHASLAHVKMVYDFDWPGALAEFERAIRLNPRYATAHQWYGLCLTAVGRLAEAGAEVKRARELDPLSLIINTDVGLMLYLQGQPDQAIDQYRKTLEIDANFFVAHFALGLAWEQKRNFSEAITEFQKAVTLSNGSTVMRATLGHGLAVAGRRAEALHALSELKQLSQQRYVSPYSVAVIYAGLGDRDEAFRWLEQAYEDHSIWLIHLLLKVDPRLDTLRSDPRFKALLEKVGLA